MTELREKVARAIQFAPMSDWRRNKARDRDNQYEVYLTNVSGDVAEILGSFSEEPPARGFSFDWNQTSRADAAIRVCREHFAGVAEAENKLPAELRCLDHATANAIASAIRAEGK